MNTNEVIENIITRTSVRTYEDRPVEKEKIMTLLKAGMAAPSAVDRRPWYFYVVTNHQKLEAIKTVTPNAAMAAKAPLAITRLFDIPRHLIPFCTIVIGYPKTEGHPKDKWNEDDVNWVNYNK